MGWLALLAAALPTWASDVLKMIPADVAAILTIRNPIEADRELTKLIRLAKPEFEGLPLADLETTLGFAPGTIDLTKRVTIVFHHPDDLPAFIKSRGLGDADQSQPVIIFTPKSEKEFSDAVGGHDDRVRRRDGIWCRYYCFTHDGRVYVSNHGKTLRSMTRLAAHETLDQRIDPVCRRVFEESDTSLHLVMTQWRARINPFVLLAANLMKLSVTAQQSPDTLAQSQAVLEWFVDGGRDALDQIQGTTFALDTDGATVSLRHAHAFVPGRWMARYLNNVRRSGREPFTTVPNRPFLFLGYSDWLCPPESSLTVQSVKMFLERGGSSQKLSAEERRVLVDASMMCARDIETGDYMLCNPTGSLMPFEFYGSYAAGDARKVLDAYELVQRHSGEMWAGFVSGSVPPASRFVHTTVDGMEVRRMDLQPHGMPEEFRKEIAQAYGKKARLEMGVVGKNHVAYSIGQPPIGVTDMAKAFATGKSIAQNAAVSEMRTILPPDSNVVLMADMNRVFKAIRGLVLWPTGGDLETEDPQPLVTAASARGSKTAEVEVPVLLGWSCRVDQKALDCRFSMDGKALATLIERIREFKDAAPGR